MRAWRCSRKRKRERPLLNMSIMTAVGHECGTEAGDGVARMDGTVHIVVLAAAEGGGECGGGMAMRASSVRRASEARRTWAGVLGVAWVVKKSSMAACSAARSRSGVEIEGEVEGDRGRPRGVCGLAAGRSVG